ncbi:MAG: replication-associated recombination protein A [Candidatus Omnitrophica bacterium]|nr:replication-associated recombination protein A [Candidatus Omnitrophota bacterium]
MKVSKFREDPEENLFAAAARDEVFKTSPLSVRMRPRNFEEYIGQEHMLGPDKLLTRAIQADRLTSLILYGPPGTGKTTLAHCISQKTKAFFEQINAVSSSVDDMRKCIAAARERRVSSSKRTILFIDEIHRFNKAQQDVLMPDVESGNIILIGATTMNPFFSLVSPLLSRSLVFELQSLTKTQVVALLKRALADKERGLGGINATVDEKALEFLAEQCDGDARRALNALEIGVLTSQKADGSANFTLTAAEESIQKKQVVYDRDGDGHYDTISAFIKSMRGSDPDATLYWLAKMIYAGEDVRFIARRICICAAEDVGLADSQALVVANAALHVSEFIGLPEARIPLAQAAVYVACAPKSNSIIKGIDQALEDVKTKKVQFVPKHLKDAHYSGAEKLGHGQGYKYSHDFEGHFVKQDYMQEQVKYYEPTDQGKEKEIGEQIKKRNSG